MWLLHTADNITAYTADNMAVYTADKMAVNTLAEAVLYHSISYRLAIDT